MVLWLNDQDDMQIKPGLSLIGLLNRESTPFRKETIFNKPSEYIQGLLEAD